MFFDNQCLRDETSMALGEGLRPAGLGANTLVQTDRGLLNAGAVVAGDYVTDTEGRLHEVAAVVEVDLAGFAVWISAGALGQGQPENDVVVAAGQRLLLDRSDAVSLLGRTDFLVTAGDLIHLPGVLPVGVSAGELVHLVFEENVTLAIEGLGAEAFLPTETAMSLLGDETRSTLFTALPRLRYRAAQAGYLTQTPDVNANEARMLLASDSTNEEDHGKVARFVSRSELADPCIAPGTSGPSPSLPFYGLQARQPITR